MLSAQYSSAAQSTRDEISAHLVLHTCPSRAGSLSVNQVSLWQALTKHSPGVYAQVVRAAFATGMQLHVHHLPHLLIGSKLHSKYNKVDHRGLMIMAEVTLGIRSELSRQSGGPATAQICHQHTLQRILRCAEQGHRALLAD